ncbi:SMI1/KNR4 family protein [Ralstonia pseudosolanacearum]
MAIDYLKALVSPPINALETTGPGGWGSVEGRLGTALPEDYKEFIEAYGSGQLGGFIWIFNPFSSNDNLNLEKQATLQAAVLNELRSYGEVVPYESFPSHGGILPFGITDNGDVLYWKTGGNPRDWPVLVNEARSPEWEVFSHSAARFLAGIFAGSVVCKLFPKKFPGPVPRFEASP